MTYHPRRYTVFVMDPVSRVIFTQLGRWTTRGVAVRVARQLAERHLRDVVVVDKSGTIVWRCLARAVNPTNRNRSHVR